MSAELTAREEALWRAFTMMGRQLNASVEQRLQAAAGVSVPDFEILQALDDAEAGRARVGELAAMLGWEKSRASHHVSRMVARGLVRRAACEEDLRGSWVALADAGVAALAKARPAHAQEVREKLFDAVGAEAADGLRRAALGVIAATDAGECTAAADEIRAALD